MARRCKFDSLKLVDRFLSKTFDKVVMPRRRPPRRWSSFFDMFMNEITLAPRRRK
jgi:hypothetical protein